MFIRVARRPDAAPVQAKVMVQYCMAISSDQHAGHPCSTGQPPMGQNMVACQVRTADRMLLADTKTHQMRPVSIDPPALELLRQRGERGPTRSTVNL